jgi:3'(2'), 5'-bisphosphate nucleotidase
MKEFLSLPLPAIQKALFEAGEWAKEMARQPFQVEQKGPEDFVTAIDRTLDQRLAVQFQQWFPDDGIITEENSDSIPLIGHNFSRLWLIDPIDGTEDFIHGRPDYSIMAGLLMAGQPRAGWILRPESGQLFCGGPDWGLFTAKALEEPSIFTPMVTPGPSVEHCPILLGTRDRLRYGEALQRMIPEAQFYTLGSFGLKVLDVMLGKAGLYLYLNGRVKLWDTVGPLALAQQAGLVCCDLEGQSLKFSTDALDLSTLAHRQAIVIGWPRYIEALLPRLQKALSYEAV